MGQVLDGCSTTTHAVRAAIQRSKALIQALAEQYGLNRKTVRQCRWSLVRIPPRPPNDSSENLAEQNCNVRPQTFAIAPRRRERRAPPTAPTPISISAHTEGSGTTLNPDPGTMPRNWVVAELLGDVSTRNVAWALFGFNEPKAVCAP